MYCGRFGKLPKHLQEYIYCLAIKLIKFSKRLFPGIPNKRFVLDILALNWFPICSASHLFTLNQKILMCKQSHNKWLIVSVSNSQKVHLSESFIFQSFNFLFVTSVRCQRACQGLVKDSPTFKNFLTNPWHALWNWKYLSFADFVVVYIFKNKLCHCAIGR